MFNPKPKPKETSQKQPSQPRDALADLMDGKTPDDKSLRFPDERTTSWRAGNTSSRSQSNGLEDYRGDYSFNSKPNTAMGEYRPQQNKTMDTMRNGAANTGNYIKTKSTAGANYVKERDWSKEKELAGKAGTATKNGAVYVGSGLAKGAGWLWTSGKNGVGKLQGFPPKEQPKK